MRSVDQKCCSSVSIRRYHKCGSAVLLKLLMRSVAQKSRSEKCRSEVLLRSVDQKKCGSVAQTCRSEVSIRSVAQEVDQKKPLSEVSLRSVDQKKCGSEVLIRCRSKSSLRNVNCCSEVSMLLRNVAQKCQFSSVAQKCRSEVCWSEVLLISVNQKCGSAVLLKLSIRSVKHEKGSSQVSVRSVDQKCCSEASLKSVNAAVLLRSVVQKCRSEVSFRGVDEQCGPEVLVRSVAQNCR